MFLVYIDDSGDEHVRCFSALLIHETVWRDTQKALRDYRRSLKQSDGIYVTKELHATEFVAGRGQIGPSTVSKWRRCEIFRETLKLAANLPKVRMLNAFGSKANERVLFERLLTRINHSVSAWKSHALVIHDEGKDYTYLVRRLGVYNPVPSQYGVWPDGQRYRNMPTSRLLEDIVYHDSRQSTFIQLADFCAYALFRSEVPLASKARYGLDNAFMELELLCIKAAYGKDPRGLGIIRYP